MQHLSRPLWGPISSCDADCLDTVTVTSTVSQWFLDTASVEELLGQAVLVNALAKTDSPAYYQDKELLLREIISRGGSSPAPWGLGEDEVGRSVLYFELPGRGQVSFHVHMWGEAELANVPVYDAGWTGIVGGCTLPEERPAPPVDAGDKRVLPDGLLLDLEIRSGIRRASSGKGLVWTSEPQEPRTGAMAHALLEVGLY